MHIAVLVILLVSSVAASDLSVLSATTVNNFTSNTLHQNGDSVYTIQTYYDGFNMTKFNLQWEQEQVLSVRADSSFLVLGFIDNTTGVIALNLFDDTVLVVDLLLIDLNKMQIISNVTVKQLNNTLVAGFPTLPNVPKGAVCVLLREVGHSTKASELLAIIDTATGSVVQTFPTPLNTYLTFWLTIDPSTPSSYGFLVISDGFNNVTIVQVDTAAVVASIKMPVNLVAQSIMVLDAGVIAWISDSGSNIMLNTYEIITTTQLSILIYKYNSWSSQTFNSVSDFSGTAYWNAFYLNAGGNDILVSMFEYDSSTKTTSVAVLVDSLHQLNPVTEPVMNNRILYFMSYNQTSGQHQWVSIGQQSA